MTVADFVFGKPFGFINAGSDFLNLITTVDGRGTCVNALGALPIWLRPWMAYMPFDAFWRQQTSSMKHLKTLAVSSCTERKRLANYDRKDLLSYLLSAKSEDGNPLPEVAIISESAPFIIGGSDSTANTIVHFIDLVSRDPEIQKRLQAELDDAFAKPTVELEAWVPLEAETSKLPYLNATLKETLRIRPTAAAGLERVVPKGGREIAGYYLPAGTLVSVPTYTIHHNPTLHEVGA